MSGLRALECVQQPYSMTRVGLLLLHHAPTSSEWTPPEPAATAIQRRLEEDRDAASGRLLSPRALGGSTPPSSPRCRRLPSPDSSSTSSPSRGRAGGTSNPWDPP